MVNGREEAARNAERSMTNTPGFCQLWTRNLYGAPSSGDVDRDGDSDAVDGWKSEPTSARHPGDRRPPRGTPVAWGGGARGFGHRAISLGPNKEGIYMIRSTDAGGSGKVATVPLSFPEERWGLTYLGWSETITGQVIPVPKPVINVTRATQVRDLLNKAEPILNEAIKENTGFRKAMFVSSRTFLRSSRSALPKK